MPRIAVLHRDKCVHGIRCQYECITYNPGVRMGEKTVVKGEDGYPVINEDNCIGCEISAKKCPFDAISVVNLPAELERPVHQYGVNGFRVYNLPVPKEEGVVGIIGPNGIGKSTLLKILAGQLAPNLGRDSASWDEVLKAYRGKEVQKHLESVERGTVKVSFKPQAVDSLPKTFKGTVRELLKKLGGTPTDTEALEIEHLLDRKLDEISGGELQRVAIAAALSRDASLFAFDEPTSYLDVRQRMRIARLVKRLAERKQIIVIEHDLAILDYLTDFVHVLFGKPGAFGVVSSLKGARVGMNELLDGYLKTENMRIRKTPIKFPVKPPADEWKGKTVLEYPGFEKKYETFSLSADAGQLRKGEVIGILGPNAIGKSTFMKVLAGAEASRPQLSWAARVSYKPQYLSSEFDGTVQDLIGTSPINRETYETYLADDARDLYGKMVPELSGGELQRVGIVLALARDCDVCLLDEPSAFLDIEQRIRFADVIRRVTEKTGTTTLVVDHDITLVDYVSDRLMVFDGTPGESGRAHSPEAMRSGMNRFLKEMDVTFRRDPESGRPRFNKPGSQMDVEQRKKGEYYYA